MENGNIIRRLKTVFKSRLARLLIGVFLLIILYFEIESKGTFSKIGQTLLYKINDITPLNILIILCLIITNWIIESLKWHISLRKFKSSTFIESTKSVLVGLSCGIFTPNRIGDYAGRLMYVAKHQRLQAGILNFFNGYSQNSTHLLVGTIGLFFIADELIYFDSWVEHLILFLICLVFLLIYFNLFQIIQLLRSKNINNFFSKYLINVHQIADQNRFLRLLLSLSILRYLSYVGLYIYLLQFLGVELASIDLFFHISIILLIQSGIPLPASLSMLARIEISIVILSLINIPIDIIVLSSFTLWILNIAIPAFIGILILGFSKGTNSNEEPLLQYE